MKRFFLILSLLLPLAGLTVAQNNNPMHGWHTYCQSDFSNAISYGTRTTIATCYPPDMAINYAGTAITKVGIFSDNLDNSVGGIYTCSLYLGGETPYEGIMASTLTVDVPQGLNDWAEYDLVDSVWVTGNDTIWVVWEATQPLTPYPMGVCSGSDPSGNGNWAWTGTGWVHLDYLTNGDWTVKTYFAWNEPQPQEPQDVYFAGYGNGVGKVWKNNTLIQSITDTLLVNVSSLQITDDGDIFTAGFSHDSLFNQIQGRIWLNDSLAFDAGANTVISKLALNGNLWTAAGIGENEWENVAGFVWQDGEVLYAFSDSIASHQIKALALDTITGDIYTSGCTAELEARAVVWKNDTILWVEDSLSTINAIAFDGTDIYAAGSVVHGEQTMAALWRNDSIIFSISADDAEFNAIALYDSSIYLGGYNGNSLFIWQDDSVRYEHAFNSYSNIFALTVNESGVYYAGQIDSIATVWKDGEVLYQPEDCDMVTALCVRPAEIIPEYTIIAESSNLDWGTVEGGGTYMEGDTAILVATPLIGCEFIGWNDSITDNPRNVVVTQDSTFVASFARIQYTITVQSNNPAWGSVSGGGIYYYGDTIEIAATPNPHHHFVNWSDNTTENPRTIIVTGDQSFTAYFEVNQYTITTQVSPEGTGTVQGGGTYPYGEAITLVANENTGYYFERWEDGETDNPRNVIVDGDATYTAFFKALQYEVTVESTPSEGGNVTGAGIYDYGTTATLTATPNPHYMFICWNDGTVTNPRNVIVDNDLHFQAIFHFTGVPDYNVIVEANDPSLGTVYGSGTYPEGTTVVISAAPYPNAVFTGWDDGNTDNPRSIVVTHDMEFIALFTEIEAYTITVRPENVLLGSTYGSGVYPVNEIITIGATPNNGFYFSGWQDGNMNNPRTIIVTGNAEYVASFSHNPVQTYSVTVLYDENQGFILGAGNYYAGATASIAAIPADGYTFLKWSDETTDNPKTIFVDHDIVLSAYFEYIGVEENDLKNILLYPNPANDRIRIEGLEGRNEIQIYNAYGMLIKTTSINGDEEISTGELMPGLYILRINGYSLRFVKE